METGENTLLISRSNKILHDYILSMEPSTEDGVVNVELENQGMTAMDETALVPLHKSSFLVGSDMKILMYDPDNDGRSLDITTRRKNIDIGMENSTLRAENALLRSDYKKKFEEDAETQKHGTLKVIAPKGSKPWESD